MQNITKASTSKLNAIGIKFNTDKSSTWKGVDKDQQGVLGHDYLRKYEFFLRNFLKVKNFKMLELGAGPGKNIGASARVWNKYFSNAENISVVDIQEKVSTLSEIDPKVHPIHGDLGQIKFLNSLSDNNYHFIIDDASHFWEHQVIAFENLFGSLLPGGVYICEDIQTSFKQYESNYSRSYKLDALSYFIQLSLIVSSKRLSQRGHPITQHLIANTGITALDQKELKSLEKLDQLSKKVSSITFIQHSCIIQKDV